MFKIYLVTFILVLSSINDTFAQSLQYNIRYLENSDSPCLHISLKTQVDKSGELLLRFPVGSQNIQLTSLKKGFALDKTNDPYVSKIKGQPNNKIEVNYHFCLNNPYKLIDWPIIENSFFISKIENFLATPEDNTNQSWQIKVNMEAMPNDFIVTSSFSKDARKLALDKRMKEFKDSVLVGGNDLKLHNININNKPITILSRGKLTRLNNSPDLYFKELIATQRNFWQDDDFPHYLVVLLEDTCTGIRSITNGRHYDHTMIAKLPNCSNNTLLARETPWILSHELNHAWLGYKINVDVPHQRSLLWFIEGFNDYYGLKFALKSGMISFPQYIDQYNALIRYYYLTPINQISNEEIIRNYEKDMHYQLLAQLRGHFRAQELSLHLSNRHLSLNDLMRKIYLDRTKLKTPCQREDINRIFRSYLDDPLWQDFSQKIENGTLVKFSKNALGPFATLIDKEVEVPDLGFDLKSLIESQTIRQLDINSPAYKAGLKEGQKIQGYSLNLSKVDIEVSFGMEEDGKYKEIFFTPNKIKKVIPQYILKKA